MSTGIPSGGKLCDQILPFSLLNDLVATKLMSRSVAQSAPSILVGQNGHTQDAAADAAGTRGRRGPRRRTRYRPLPPSELPKLHLPNYLSVKRSLLPVGTALHLQECNAKCVIYTWSPILHVFNSIYCSFACILDSTHFSFVRSSIGTLVSSESSMDSNARVFEDFVPPHRMVREPATHTLSVDLSDAGYKKEHIGVQMVHRHRRLIVRGERPVAGNRWSRFRLELRVPDGCDAKAIHARFENGVVRVTLPGVAPEPVQVETGAGRQQDPSPPAKPTAAAIAQDHKDDGGTARQQDGDGRGAPARGGGEDETVQKQEMRQRVSSAKDDGCHDDDAGGAGEVTTAASPSRQGYGFLHDRRRKMATTVLGVVLVMVSLGIYVKYSIWP